MNNFLIIVVFVAALTIIEIDAQSRCQNEPDGAQLPMPNSRVTYIVCNNNAEKILSCQNSFEFDPFDRKCLAPPNTGTRAMPTTRPPAGSLRDRCFNQADDVSFK